jgi:hypothetical protein
MGTAPSATIRAAVVVDVAFNVRSSSAHGWGIAMSPALALALLAVDGRRASVGAA